MKTSNQSSQEVGKTFGNYLLQMPLSLLAGNMEKTISGLVEALRCENIPVGIVWRGKELLKNGTIRVHCANGGLFIVPHWEREAIKAVIALTDFHDFTTLPVEQVRQLIWNKANNSNGAKVSI